MTIVSMLPRYHRAEAFEHESYTESLVINAQIFPHWIADSNCFWYLRKSIKPSGELAKEFRLVNAETANNVEAFDHSLLAGLLSRSSNREVDSENLPISELKLELSPLRVTFVAFNKHWAYDEIKESCEEVQIPCGLISPDGKKAAFLRDYNLWIRNLESGEERALTPDGERHYAYGTLPERVNLVAGLSGPSWVNSATPEMLWSPDSQQVLTVQVDERQVKSLPVTQYVPADGSVRPNSTHTKYALPGDEHIANYRVVAIDVDSGIMCDARYPRISDAVLWAGLFSGNRAWWSEDSRQAYFVDMARGQKRASIVAFDTKTGECRVLFEEHSSTQIDLNLEFESPASLWPLPETNELIWFSERSGWAHIYLYDLNTGMLKNAITKGKWVVREVLHVDARRREVFVQVAGRATDRDPYYRELCRVNIDTGDMVTLASSDHDYIVYKQKSLVVGAASSLARCSADCSGVSPSGDYIVTTQTRVDEIPVTKLLDRNGEVVLIAETADISGLQDKWQWPEPVRLLGADGKTDIYGAIFRPSDFSPNKQYPVLDWAFGNSFYAFVPKGAFGNDTMLGYVYMSAAALAELGFIVVVIDGRGSCYRSKAFHDEAYGQVHMGSNLDDHVAGIRQLAERYPYMDLNRVGISDTGGSSNAPVYGLFAYPDFYKVGVAMSTWDLRLLMQGEIYQGLTPDADYAQSVLGNMASKLEGKLLLMHGMLDPFFHTSGFLQLVDALVRNNCDFDMLLLPNGGHAWNSNQYGLRRMWDYLVTHLQGNTPPPKFRLSNGTEFYVNNLQSESQ